MRVTAEWSRYPVWYGRRVVKWWVEDEEWSAGWMAEVMKGWRRVGGPTLVEVLGLSGVRGSRLLQGSTRLGELMKVGKGKGWKFGVRVEANGWLEGGHEVMGWMEECEWFVLEMEEPGKFEQIEGLNELVQELWFERNMAVVAWCRNVEDVEMVEFLTGVIPRDVPFYVMGGEEVEKMMVGPVMEGLRFVRCG